MPTFTCFTAPGKLTLPQKAEIANWCTSVYHEEFGIKRYLIQVIFEEVASGDQYIAGQPAPDVVWIRCDVRSGRDEARNPDFFSGSSKALPRPSKSLRRRSGSISMTFLR